MKNKATSKLKVKTPKNKKPIAKSFEKARKQHFGLK